MNTPSLTLDELDAAAHRFTPKAFHRVRLQSLSREHSIPLPEVRSLVTAFDSEDLHWRLVQKAATNGAVLRREVLDALPEDGRYILRKFNPSCIPAGYLSPAIRAKNVAFEAEMRAARRSVA